jgi:hypothetical protein
LISCHIGSSGHAEGGRVTDAAEAFAAALGIPTPEIGVMAVSEIVSEPKILDMALWSMQNKAGRHPKVPACYSLLPYLGY